MFWNLFLPVILVSLTAATLPWPGRKHTLALRLDRWRKDRRRTFSCALDLETASPAEGLHETLRQAAVVQAVEALDTVPQRAVISFRRLGWMCLLLVVGTATMAFLWSTYPGISRTVAARLQYPDQDIAPWTPLRFDVRPEAP
jgi:hypothetical protein